MYTAVTW